jgi:hypothetical protein
MKGSKERGFNEEVNVRFLNNSYKYFANLKMRIYICNPLQKGKGA